MKTIQRIVFGCFLFSLFVLVSQSNGADFRPKEKKIIVYL